jgi:glycine cleavage system regulatory protein
MRTETGSEQGLQHSDQGDMEVIVSVTGTDNEQIIVTLSEIINRFSGRLQASRFNRIDKTFNGLFYISINLAYFGPFRACLESLNSERLHFEFSPANPSSNSLFNDKVTFEIELYGLKEKVVDVEILRSLSRNQLVVDELTRKRYINESGVPAYKARLQVSTDYIFDIDEVERELQLIAERLDLHLVVHFDEDDLQEAI